MPLRISVDPKLFFSPEMVSIAICARTPRASLARIGQSHLGSCGVGS